MQGLMKITRRRLPHSSSAPSGQNLPPPPLPPGQTNIPTAHPSHACQARRWAAERIGEPRH
eukprot:365083-Chlamydomonas_euryale.AAC.32